MGYAFVSVSKLKNAGNMVSKYNHNFRKVEVTNAIPEREGMNEVLVPLPQKEDGTEMRYDEAFRQRISELPYYEGHKIRKDQVLGYEVLLTYSRDESVDVEEWKKRSVGWLEETFNVAGDGKPNVLSAVFHNDETGNVHIHAFVVPIDERGHLNATRFTNGSRAMSDIQSSYAASVKDLGLERGLAGSSATHQMIRKMYADMNAAAKLPEVEIGETAIDYRRRIQEAAETMFLTRHKAAGDFERESRRRADEYRLGKVREAREEIEIERSRHAGAMALAREQRKAIERELAEKKEQVKVYQGQLDELTQQMYEIRTSITLAEEEKENATFGGRIKLGVELVRIDDPSRADRMENDIEEAIARAKAREEREAIMREKEAQEQTSLS